MLLFILLLVFVLSLTTVRASNVGLDDHSVKSQNDNNGYVTIQKTKSNINKHLVRTNKNKDKSDLEKDVSNRKYISLETSKKYNTNKPTRLIKLADGLKFIKYNVNKGIFIPKTGIWTIGDLKPGQNLVLSIVTQATTTGEKVTKAFLKSDTHITTPDEIYEEEEINVEDKHHSSDTTNNVNTHKVASNTVATSAYKTAFPIGLLVLSIFAIFVTSIKRIV